MGYRHLTCLAACLLACEAAPPNRPPPRVPHVTARPAAPGPGSLGVDDEAASTPGPDSLGADEEAPDEATIAGEAAEPAPAPPVLSDCVEDESGEEPGCVWRRFEILRHRPDVEVKLTLTDEGCLAADMRPPLVQFTRAPLSSLRATRWVHSMTNHCATQIPDCAVDGTVTWKGYAIAVHLNHEGRGSVSSGDASDALAIPGMSGGSCAD